MREYNIGELKNLIREAYLDLITENAESSNRKNARRLLKDKKYVIRDNFKAGDEEERIVINTLPSVRYNHFKFAIFFYSLYYQYKKEINKDDVWKLINTYFFNILKEEGDNFDYARYLINKNDYTLIPLNDLLNIIENYNLNRGEDNNQDYNAIEYPYNGYKIVKITSFIQSQEYSKYCDWCVVKTKHLYDKYTNNGENCFYYCLRYDYKDTNEPLSMLAVLVDDYGDLKQVTTRENNGDHYYKTEQEVEEHFKINNFSSVFKPLTKEELKQAQEEEQKIKEDYQKNIKQYLKQGHNIEDILRKAYDGFGYDEDIDLFKIEDKDKENYINKQGDLLSNEWYDNIWYLESEDYFIVFNNNKENYIDKEGNLLSDLWGDDITYVVNADLFEIKIENKYNLIDREGNLLFTEWYDYIKYFYELKLFNIKKGNKQNFIDKQDNLIFNEWYDRIIYEEDIKLFWVKNNNTENYIDREGNLLFKQWYDSVSYDYVHELFQVNHNDKRYYIDVNENIVKYR